ncbi:NUDIX hydrolase [Croceicoccus estronivorus]|uniref:NUDIX hydrolase n=1 Tax=Croceicoccus estronivorus TaxID=1172626 RepID=UPI000831221C|nr:NUDIX domain-containing protein [Croceicoccus estronivorus]OCC23249.1 NUDIX hydrolase [Croceicoccus estronivorus]
MEIEVDPQSLPPAQPAATVVIFRRGQESDAPELLMLVRSKTLSFVGGAAVFPGGRVDPADFELAASLAPEQEADEIAHRIAAIRETLEETGLAIGLTQPVNASDATAARAMLHEGASLAEVLGQFDWNLAFDALTPFAQWLPRFKHTRIFDTRFYLTDLGTGAVDIAVDGTENTRMFWASARDALAMADSGKIKAIFPTRRNLERLAQFNDFAAARADAERHPILPVTPWIDERDGKKIVRIREDCGYPVCWGHLSEVAG